MAREGAEQLIVAERAVDTAFIEVTALMNLLCRRRLESNLAMSVGRDAMAKLVSSINNLQAVRDDMIDTHEHLNDVKTQIGCRTVMVGHLDKPDGAAANATTGLHVVAGNRTA
ncbi:hypothetical protein ABENE_08030 [Asticcacaulis benevestitus DSM 16100 = ATCC BAA-896]|uniref:Flagellin N-terminal domain-containing protein n=2 Tax=Asticcacaulis TaxID=76890 RepID=V4PF54_9CAUL|nr:hypothetical protein ABENE_08030 [Asticcacaulis benevestitus DSM 16100 = ATCC BAA-896]